jgi:hypothetical protein
MVATIPASRPCAMTAIWKGTVDEVLADDRHLHSGWDYA